MPQESFEPFLQRPSFYLDETIPMQYHVPYIPDAKGEDLFQEKDVVTNLLNFLDSLNLEESSSPVSIVELRNELLDDEKMKEDIAQRMQSEQQTAPGTEPGMEGAGDMDMGAGGGGLPPL